jgi:hypothetical protein
MGTSTDFMKNTIDDLYYISKFINYEEDDIDYLKVKMAINSLYLLKSQKLS